MYYKYDKILPSVQPKDWKRIQILMFEHVSKNKNANELKINVFRLRLEMKMQ